MSYLRSKLQAPSRNICGSVLRWPAASVACLSIHFLPSARQSAASAGSALMLSLMKTLAWTVLFLIVASGLESAANAVVEIAKDAIAPTRNTLRANENAARCTKCSSINSRRTQLLRRLAMPEPRVQLVDQLLGGVGDHGAGRIDRLGAGLVQRVVILRRHHAADDDHDILAALLLQRGLQFRHRGQMCRRQRRHAEDVDVIFDRLTRRFVGGGEQRSDIDVEADIGKGRCDHLLAAVVAVLADLGDQDAR